MGKGIKALSKSRDQELLPPCTELTWAKLPPSGRDQDVVVSLLSSDEESQIGASPRVSTPASPTAASSSSLRIPAGLAGLLAGAKTIPPVVPPIKEKKKKKESAEKEKKDSAEAGGEGQGEDKTKQRRRKLISHRTKKKPKMERVMRKQRSGRGERK